MSRRATEPREFGWTESDFQRRQTEIVAEGKAMRGPSLAERVCRLPREALDFLTPIQWFRLRYDWRFWGRPKQLAAIDPGPWDDALYLAGRSFGKTRTGAEIVRDRICRGLAKSICLIGPDTRDVRRNMVGGLPDTDSGILDVFPPWYPRGSAEGIDYNQNKQEIYVPRHGATIYLNSGEVQEQRGGNFDLIWIDEPIKFRYLETVFMNLDMALRRATAVPQRIITTTPMRQDWLRDLIMQPRTKVIHGVSSENASNVAERFTQRLRERYEGTRIGQQEIEALILGDNQSAITSSPVIDETRMANQPAAMSCVGVGIDPAVSTKRTSDDSGIVVAGRCGDELFLLEDATGRYTADGWAERAVQLAKDWGAKFIIVERNKIGDAGVTLVRHAIARLQANVEIREAYSFKDKWTRAQPVSALYDRKRVHHVGRFPELERQLTQWDPQSDWSPNNLDAFVHVAIELMDLAKEPEPTPGNVNELLSFNRKFAIANYGRL